MNRKTKRMISLMSAICILSALLAGCGGEEVIEVVRTEPQTQQTEHQEMQQPMEMQAVEIGEEDAAALVQAGLDAVAEESELWSITEMADAEVLMGLMQGQGGAERPESRSFGGEAPENMTPPDGEFGEGPNGEIPGGTMPERDSETPPENMQGTFPEGEMPDGGQGRGEGGGKEPGNRGGSMAALAIVIANTDGAAVAVEDVLAAIDAAAEVMGYSAMGMEITEEQSALLEIPEGYTGSRIVLLQTRMPVMENMEK